jgi:hypothetical protein
MRSGEVLHKDVAWQLAAKARTRILIRDLRLEFGVKNTNLAGQHCEVQQHIGMEDEERERSQYEEAKKRQLNTEKRQPHRVLKEEIAVRHGARRDEEVEEQEKIAEPQASADPRSVNDSLAQGVKIFCLGGEGLC